jgi:hypothetical protein
VNDNFDDNQLMNYYCPHCMHQSQCLFGSDYRQDVEDHNRQKQGPPTSPPPDFTPQLPHTQGSIVKAVDPGAIRPCVFRFSYIWLNNRQSFWAYLVFVGRTSAAGWRYQGRRWVYFGIDLRQIRSFTCY